MQCLFHSEVFRDALQMCETTPSIETMVTIINEVAASEDEAVINAFKTTRAMWLTQPAIIRHPTKKMIGSLMVSKSLQNKILVVHSRSEKKVRITDNFCLTVTKIYLVKLLYLTNYNVHKTTLLCAQIL